MGDDGGRARADTILCACGQRLADPWVLGRREPRAHGPASAAEPHPAADAAAVSLPHRRRPPVQEAAEASPADLPEEPWNEIRPQTSRLPRPDLREVWAYREAGLLLALRTIKALYKQTFIGVAWVILAPLGSVVVYSLVFGRLAGLPSDGRPYAVFVFAGMVLWNYFAAGLGAAASSLVDERELVTKVYFPRVVAPAAALLPPMLNMAMALGTLAVLMAAAGVAPGVAIVTLPLWIGAAVLLALGGGLAAAALNVRFRDVGHVLGYLVQLWFFTSPVLFASSQVGGGLRVLLGLNPMTGIIDGFRWAVIATPPPPVEDLSGVVVGAALLVGGVLYFERTQRRFADVI
jgi:lipopolysaccharide transport system permease protein